MEEKKFPIKYTVVGMREGENIIVYIATKCFVMGIVTLFDRNGRASINYEVSLPFKSKNDDELTYKGLCVSCESVDMLFDSYDDALIVADARNEVMEEKIILEEKAKRVDQEAVSHCISEIKKVLEEAREFQKYIEDNTQDLVIYSQDIDHSISLKRIFKEGE